MATLLFVLALGSYVVIALWITRGSTFIADDMFWFAEADDYSLGSLFEPYNGHLVAVARLLVTVSVDLFGTAYLPLRLVTFAFVMATASVVFFLLRTRLGGVAALVPTVIILFLGVTPEPLEFSSTPFVQSTLGGLVAIVALGRRTRTGDLVGAGALVFSTLAFELGPAFAVGVGVWLRLDRREWRALWVIAPALIVYAAWWLWALDFNQGLDPVPAQILLWPSFSIESLATAAAAFAGLGLDPASLTSSERIESEWGPLLAILYLLGLAFGMRRNGPTALIAGLAVAILAVWAALALTMGLLRTPDASRYAWHPVVILALIAGETYRRWRPGGAAALLLLAFLVFALPGNLFALRQGGAEARQRSEVVRGQYGAVELLRDSVAPTFRPTALLPNASEYLEGVDRHGSYAYSPAELSTAGPTAKLAADDVLSEILVPRLQPFGGAIEKCEAEATREPGSGDLELPPGGGVLIASRGANVELRRFADHFTVQVGTLPPGLPRALELPRDASPVPWRASVTGPVGDLGVCPLPGGSRYR